MVKLLRQVCWLCAKPYAYGPWYGFINECEQHSPRPHFCIFLLLSPSCSFSLSHSETPLFWSAFNLVNIAQTLYIGIDIEHYTWTWYNRCKDHCRQLILDTSLDRSLGRSMILAEWTLNKKLFELSEHVPDHIELCENFFTLPKLWMWFISRVYTYVMMEVAQSPRNSDFSRNFGKFQNKC